MEWVHDETMTGIANEAQFCIQIHPLQQEQTNVVLISKKNVVLKQ
jgi:hypothetical protein